MPVPNMVMTAVRPAPSRPHIAHQWWDCAPRFTARTPAAQPAAARYQAATALVLNTLTVPERWSLHAYVCLRWRDDAGLALTRRVVGQISVAARTLLTG